MIIHWMRCARSTLLRLISLTSAWVHIWSYHLLVLDLLSYLILHHKTICMSCPCDCRHSHSLLQTSNLVSTHRNSSKDLCQLQFQSLCHDEQIFQVTLYKDWKVGQTSRSRLTNWQWICLSCKRCWAKCIRERDSWLVLLRNTVWLCKDSRPRNGRHGGIMDWGQLQNGTRHFVTCMADDSYILAEFADSDEAFAMMILNYIGRVVPEPNTWTKEIGVHCQPWMGACGCEHSRQSSMLS